MQFNVKELFMAATKKKFSRLPAEENFYVRMQYTWRAYFVLIETFDIHLWHIPLVFGRMVVSRKLWLLEYDQISMN